MRMKRRWAIAASVLVVAALIAAAALIDTHRRAGEPPLPARGGRAMEVAPSARVPYYLQNDVRWGAETIGGSGEQMAQAGCTVACVAMGLSSLGQDLNPSQVCARLKQQGGFTSDGLVIWGKVRDVTDGAVEVGPAPLSYQAVDAELIAKRPVIAKIMLGGTLPHWVLIVGKDGQEYLAMDPLNQQRKVIRVSDRSPAIYAVRVFRSR